MRQNVGVNTPTASRLPRISCGPRTCCRSYRACIGDVLQALAGLNAPAVESPELEDGPDFGDHRYAKVCTITGPAIAVAGPASSGVRLCSIHASTRLFDSAAPA